MTGGSTEPGPEGPGSEGKEWRTVYYKSASGSAPVREFIEEQDARTQAAIRSDLVRLRRFNVRLGAPYVRKLAGREFWELRTRVDGEAYRTFYFAYSGRKFVLLHAFQKKSQQTPKKELETAEARMKDYLKRSERSQNRRQR